MISKRITIRHVVLTGPQKSPADLEFKSGLNLLYGASNTGKSYAIKVIDFMLGATTELPELPEGKGYDRAWLGITLEGEGDFSLCRSTQGGGYELFRGLTYSYDSASVIEVLAPTQKTKKEKSLGQYILEYLGVYGSQLAKNSDGVKENISLRDFVAISLVDETNIQSEKSPIESGDTIFKTRERSLFRFLLSGVDDSSIVTVIDPKTFVSSKAARIDVVEEMIADIEKRIENHYPDIDDLENKDEALSLRLESIQENYDSIQMSIRKLIEEKSFLSREIPFLSQRVEEIGVHLTRFSYLDSIYLSDLERLSALDEAGFLLSVLEPQACSLCGADAQDQKITQDVLEISSTRAAAVTEISKIAALRDELKITVNDLVKEKENLLKDLPSMEGRLKEVEENIYKSSPEVLDSSRMLNEIIRDRDHIKIGLSLKAQNNSLNVRLKELQELKKPSKEDKPKLKTSDAATYEFCTIVGSVLKEWNFPGSHIVSFDDKNFDLKIDGKPRINNGKGVRAITHSAFKVALLIYCQKNNIPHPGFLVLDTPLLTYRDPMKNKKAGPLQRDEEELAGSTLKESFFRHLASISNLGQIIVIENVDPPRNIEDIAHVQIFYGVSGDRYGLFPVDAPLGDDSSDQARLAQ